MARTTIALAAALLATAGFVGSASAQETHTLPVLLGEVTTLKIVDADTSQQLVVANFDPPLQAGESAGLNGVEYVVTAERGEGKSDWLHIDTSFCNALVFHVTIRSFSGAVRTQTYSVDDCREDGEARFPAGSTFDGYIVATIDGCGDVTDFLAAVQVVRGAAGSGTRVDSTRFRADPDAGTWSGQVIVRGHDASTDVLSDRLPRSWSAWNSGRSMILGVPCQPRRVPGAPIFENKTVPLQEG